ncbi:MAG: ATP-binding cassette domain-containing protein [Clostridia bacterium]|nr:ATP-binding cassette domain-containing protein [Clostridia bacterium]
MLSVDIRKRFAGFTLDVRFEAEDGVTALLGASGCGKSVTLRCIAGVLRPDEGTIYRDGEALFDRARGVDLPPQKRRVGLLFQNYALFPNMTLRRNIEAGLGRLPGRAARRARADELIGGFRLAGLEDRYPHELSGGQQQRAALCRILASEPKTLLLDEPFSALDNHLKWQLEREMQETLKRFSGTALLVTHDRGEAFRLSGRACVMSGGRNEPVVPTEALFADPRTRTAALLSGCKNFSAVERRGAEALFARDWGAALRAAAAVPERARWLGVRAHHLRFGAASEENAVPVVVTAVTPDLFSDAYTCVSRGGGELRVELPKAAPGAPQAGQEACVIVPRDAMMLLE